MVVVGLVVVENAMSSIVVVSVGVGAVVVFGSKNQDCCVAPAHEPSCLVLFIQVS